MVGNVITRKDWERAKQDMERERQRNLDLAFSKEESEQISPLIPHKNK